MFFVFEQAGFTVFFMFFQRVCKNHMPVYLKVIFVHVELHRHS